MNHEIALRTKNKTKECDQYNAYFNKFDVACCISDRIKRLKWVEIFADFASPKKRNRVGQRLITNGYLTNDKWQAIVDNWTQELWDMWFENSKLAEIDRYPNIYYIWTTEIASVSGLIDFIGKDKKNKINLTDSWLWSDKEKKIFCIVPNDDLSQVEAESLTEVTETLEQGKITFKKKNYIDYEKDLGFSSNLIDDINNINKIVDPEYDIIIKKNKIKIK